MEEQEKKKRGCCLPVLIALLLVLVLLVAAVAIGYKAILSKIPRVDKENEVTLSEEEIQAIEQETDPVEEIPQDVTVPQETVEEMTAPVAEEIILENEGHIINILLIGQDRRPGEGRQRSDSMILCTINTQKKTLVMTSFLRDLYVDIPDWRGRSYLDNRLNACYAFGGMGMLDLALKQNFGVQVDHNIEVDFSGFEDILELVGGVNVYMSNAEARYLSAVHSKNFVEGINYLNAQEALNFSRLREIDSDFGRTNRQRRVLSAMFDSIKGMNYDQMAALVNKILPMITTDMKDGDITRYMMEILPILPQLQLSTQYIPANGTYRNASIRGMAVLVPDFGANIAILRDTIA